MNKKNENLDFSHIGFFVWLCKNYGTTINCTYAEIARRTRIISYGSVRYYLLELEKGGWIVIENKGGHRQTYHLNIEKINGLRNDLQD